VECLLALRRPGCAKDYVRGLSAPHGDRSVEPRRCAPQADKRILLAMSTGLARSRPCTHAQREATGLLNCEAGCIPPSERRLCLGAGDRGARQECARAKTAVNRTPPVWATSGARPDPAVCTGRANSILMRNLLRTRKAWCAIAAAILSSGCKRRLRTHHHKLDSVISTSWASRSAMIDALIAAGEKRSRRLAQLPNAPIKAPPERFASGCAGPAITATPVPVAPAIEKQMTRSRGDRTTIVGGRR